MTCGKNWGSDMYRIRTTDSFDKSFRKLDRSVQVMVKRWIDKHLSGTIDPRQQGKGLSSNFRGLWRYRIGDYRLLVEIEDEELVIIAIDIGHRSKIYAK